MASRFFSSKFSENFFRETSKFSSDGFPKLSSFKRNKREQRDGIKGSNAADYAGLRLDCTGGPAILFPFFAQNAKKGYNIH